MNLVPNLQNLVPITASGHDHAPSGRVKVAEPLLKKVLARNR